MISWLRKKYGWKPKTLVLDVDGVLTDGKFWYDESGKRLKAFGIDDYDAMRMVMPYMDIILVTGDANGLGITTARARDMGGMRVNWVDPVKRASWIRDNTTPSDVAYMGDGILDPLVFAEVGYSICPAGALDQTKRAADFVTTARGGERAVAEACLHLLGRFFE